LIGALSIITSIALFVPIAILIYFGVGSTGLSEAEMAKVASTYVLDFKALRPEPAERFCYVTALAYFPIALYFSFRFFRKRVTSDLAIQISDKVASALLMALALISILLTWILPLTANDPIISGYHIYGSWMLFGSYHLASWIVAIGAAWCGHRLILSYETGSATFQTKCRYADQACSLGGAEPRQRNH
jgi:hypothetical protein